VAQASITRWVNWILRRGWILTEVHATEYCGSIPTALSPYFVEVWKHNQTSEVRLVMCQ